MSDEIKNAANDLYDALKALEGTTGLRVYRDIAGPGAAIQPPAVVLSAPRFAWQTGCVGAPTDARWLVYVIAAAGERALEVLWGYLPAVAEAIDSVPSAAVIQADPGAYQASSAELPCYEIQVDVGL
ncbi:hypothetical protein O7626_31400 [Micromonospora sp. WMMD1102]|uniref:hypothetical protein n=1 Tax=Micromonospora sp. WMMD1102 TaxID=3016105 RepID=UPI002415506F|nr:hypothetical protein [Micromonospora sp. WMMD1102]MDG4790375.1 hypothetical protein [Micromonospora sp. WMMD1102]